MKILVYIKILKSRQQKPLKKKLQRKLSTISMKSSQIIAMFKLLLFWWETPKQSSLILLGWRFDLIIDYYSVNILNCMKIKGQEVQVVQLMTFKFGKKRKKMKYSNYLFSWHRRFQISSINSRTSLFQVEGSNVGQNLLFNFCNYLILIFCFM